MLLVSAEKVNSCSKRLMLSRSLFATTSLYIFLKPLFYNNKILYAYIPSFHKNSVKIMCRMKQQRDFSPCAFVLTIVIIPQKKYSSLYFSSLHNFPPFYCMHDDGWMVQQCTCCSYLNNLYSKRQLRCVSSHSVLC